MPPFVPTDGPPPAAAPPSTPDAELVQFAQGLRLAVGRSLGGITSFVLREQGDWFEDELRFLRRWVKPGMAALDVGANHGVYALSLGALVGSAGRVWAFEPTPAVADLLQRSIAANRLSWVTLRREALSERSGSATFFTQGNSELNSLQASPGTRATTVPLLTLDGFAAEGALPPIDFLKLDAEGEELAIVRGGEAFLRAHSPLVMFELKHGAAINHALLAAFAERGFAPYRLVPGLQVLVPFAPQDPPDPYLLNLFAARPATAAKLATEGHLSLGAQSARATAGAFARRLGQAPYLNALGGGWSASPPDRAGLEEVLDLHALAHDPEASAALRHGALGQAFDRATALAAARPSLARLFTLGRLAAELGYRAAAVDLCGGLLATWDRQRLTLDEPFLTLAARYEQLGPEGRLREWCLAQLLERHVQLRTFSSYYAGPQGLPELARFAGLGFPSPELQRRLELLRTLR